MQIKRRTVLSGLVGLSLPFIAATCATSSSESASNTTTSPETAATSGASNAIAKLARLGYQKATDLDLLRTRGELDKRLQQQGVTGEWSLFPSGPPMLEAMNAGSLDFGGVGDAPPIFAQAAGGQFYYVSLITLGAETQDIVVLKNSSIQSTADLRGKKVALQRGSSAHFLLLKALEEQNIPASEVEVVSLSPADARGAFEQGNVDAWSIWDPFLAVAQATGNTRDLKVGRDRRTFFLASQQFAQSHSNVLKVILEEAKKTGEWASQNISTVAEQFAKDVNLPAEILEVVYQRRNWKIEPVNQQIQTAQQQVADTFYSAQIIPKAIQVKDAFLPAEEYAKIFPS
jgi:sulfonate transport system substrate-binding protein